MSLTLGSHLVTPRIGYTHHGIYIGNHQVIHFTSNSKVEIVSLCEFTDGKGYTDCKFHSNFSRTEIVQRAISRLGGHDYNVVFNNCEHFCNWCIHDKHRSQQIRDVTLGSATTGLVAQSLIKQAPRITALTLAEISTVNGSSMTAGFTLLSTPIIPAALVGFGVFKLVQFLSD